MGTMVSIDWTRPRLGATLRAEPHWERRCKMLHEFLKQRRAEIIARAKAKVAGRAVPRPTEAELEHGIPLFFDQLIDTLKRSTLPSDEMNASATKHGDDMLRLGFSVGQVVHDYGNVCQAVTELAFELNAPITVDEFNRLNRCLDDATAMAVTEYGRLHAQSLADQETERMGALAHELRNRLQTAMMSFEALQGGSVPISGSTGAVLDRSLKGLKDLIDRSVEEARLKSTLQRREPILLTEFVEEVETAAVIEANAHGHQLTVEQLENGVAVEADRQMLAAAVANLLQNAFKFTPDPG